MLNSIDWPMPMQTSDTNSSRNARACSPIQRAFTSGGTETAETVRPAPAREIHELLSS